MRLAFFGSDHFSIQCLKQILPLPSHISHIDIISRHPKLSGRGLKQLKDVPISKFATDNNLPLLRADKKSDFDSLPPYNLAIAVSYGKLIPSSFLNTLTYPGLNVHPSLLPKYSGPAPLQRALLNNDAVTGVSVQTLHPTEFDKGDILAQESYNINPDESFITLSNHLASIGGKLLNDILVNKLYDPSNPQFKLIKPSTSFSYAYKIKPKERQIQWDNSSIDGLIRTQNTIGNLYTFKSYTSKDNVISYKRIIFSDIKRSKTPNDPSIHNGSFSLLPDNSLDIKTSDGWINVEKLGVEGIGLQTAKKFFSSLKKNFNNIEHMFYRIDQ